MNPGLLMLLMFTQSAKVNAPPIGTFFLITNDGDNLITNDGDFLITN